MSNVANDDHVATAGPLSKVEDTSQVADAKAASSIKVVDIEIDPGSKVRRLQSKSCVL